MELFLSTYINKIDKKGRVSIPASYRAVIGANSYNGIVVHSSLNNECIEACSFDRIKELNNYINQLDPYSYEYNAFATLILGSSVELSFDTEGRVMLPETLMSFAGITDQVCFVGKGKSFEVWNPDKFADYSKNLRKDILKSRPLLKTNGGANG